MKLLPNGHKILRIVITGGPCSGKTTAIKRLPKLLEKAGYHILIMPEAATQLITSGITPWDCQSTDTYQELQIKYQLAREELYMKAAEDISEKHDCSVLILYDRGMLDNRAYMDDDVYDRILGKMGLSKKEVMGWYDAVFHLETAAKGALKAYTCANNAARTETAEEAIEVNYRTLMAWQEHTKRFIIDNSTGFKKKLNRLYEGILTIVDSRNPSEKGL